MRHSSRSSRRSVAFRRSSRYSPNARRTGLASSGPSRGSNNRPISYRRRFRSPTSSSVRTRTRSRKFRQRDSSPSNSGSSLVRYSLPSLAFVSCGLRAARTLRRPRGVRGGRARLAWRRRRPHRARLAPHVPRDRRGSTARSLDPERSTTPTSFRMPPPSGVSPTGTRSCRRSPDGTRLLGTTPGRATRRSLRPRLLAPHAGRCPEPIAVRTDHRLFRHRLRMTALVSPERDGGHYPIRPRKPPVDAPGGVVSVSMVSGAARADPRLPRPARHPRRRGIVRRLSRRGRPQGDLDDLTIHSKKLPAPSAAPRTCGGGCPASVRSPGARSSGAGNRRSAVEWCTAFQTAAAVRPGRLGRCGTRSAGGAVAARHLPESNLTRDSSVSRTWFSLSRTWFSLSPRRVRRPRRPRPFIYQHQPHAEFPQHREGVDAPHAGLRAQARDRRVLAGGVHRLLRHQRHPVFGGVRRASRRPCRRTWRRPRDGGTADRRDGRGSPPSPPAIRTARPRPRRRCGGRRCRRGPG